MQSSFSMQESLPQLLEALVIAAYKDVGLDLTNDMPSNYAGRLPTFRHFVRPNLFGSRLVDRVVRRLGYAQQARETLTAALLVRVESFSMGVKARLFSGRHRLDWDDLLRRPCFIELSDLSDPLVRRFVLGALVLRIASMREAEARRNDARDVPFRHLLVLEEAHHFLRRPNGTAPGAELVQQSNELLADALAELRSYGQGILVADQSPAELAPSVIRNTNLKIAHALHFEEDCLTMGNAMGIDAENRAEMRRLARGEALVNAPGFDGPLHAKILSNDPQRTS
jgi:hypothetical protein